MVLYLKWIVRTNKAAQERKKKKGGGGGGGERETPQMICHVEFDSCSFKIHQIDNGRLDVDLDFSH